MVAARKGMINKGRIAAGSCMYLCLIRYNFFKLQIEVACEAHAESIYINILNQSLHTVPTIYSFNIQLHVQL